MLAVVIVACGISCMVVGEVAGAALRRGRAKTAADAAALAGAADGVDAARAVASANGATLRSFDQRGDETTVRVTLGDAGARARAVRVGPRFQGGIGDVNGLAPAIRAALARAGQLLGQPVPITSGFRTRAQQAALWNHRASNPYPVAPPGSSMHERGLAIDVPASFVARLLTVGARAGLCQPYPRTDMVHFELCRPG